MKCERGATIVEAAVVFPILFLLLIGIFGFGVMWANYQMMTDAAREGARYAVTAPPGSNSLPTASAIAQNVCGHMFGNLAAVICSQYVSGGATPPTIGTCVINGGSIPSGQDIYVTQCNVNEPNHTAIRYTEVDIRKSFRLSFLPSIPLHTTAVMRNETN
jgi:Flp pilus assembly protein TadG